VDQPAQTVVDLHQLVHAGAAAVALVAAASPTCASAAPGSDVPYTKLINKSTGIEDQPRIDFINTALPTAVVARGPDRLQQDDDAFDVIPVSDQAGQPGAWSSRDATTLSPTLRPITRKIDCTSIRERARIVPQRNCRRINTRRMGMPRSVRSYDYAGPCHVSARAAGNARRRRRADRRRQRETHGLTRPVEHRWTSAVRETALSAGAATPARHRIAVIRGAVRQPGGVYHDHEARHGRGISSAVSQAGRGVHETLADPLPANQTSLPVS
jgi:hypothetical protein